MRQAAVSRGEDIQNLPRQYAALINEALADKPADMTVAIHLCRGNFRSRHFASGGYEPVAEVLLQELNVDNYLLEFDDERSGGFEPLRFLPKDGKKRVTLGLISTKTGVLEDKAAVVKRVHEAAKYAPLEQLGVGPQCGWVATWRGRRAQDRRTNAASSYSFASTSHGNSLTEEEQWAKIKLCVEVAEEVWGKK